ncbi:MAG: FUSC family protein [Oceanobacter sp.]
MSSSQPPSIWFSLLGLGPHKRPLHFIALVGLCSGLPAFIGAIIGDFQHGLMAVMGAMAVMYLPFAPLPQRMVTIQVVAFGLACCFGLGLVGSIHPLGSALTLGMTAFLISLVTGYFKVPPPANFFFIMVASIAAVIPHDMSAVPERVGLLVMGSMGSALMAFGYALLFPINTAAGSQAIQSPSRSEIHSLISQSVVMGLFVGGSYWLAILIGLNNPYWVPISCAAVMQGVNLRHVWLRQIHRISGTAIGMVLAWGLFSVLEGPWLLTLAIVLLSFLIEMLITRNYGYAVIFITPLTVIFSEVASVGVPTDELASARLIDIVLGSVMGFVGGWVIHKGLLPRFRDSSESKL